MLISINRFSYSRYSQGTVIIAVFVALAILSLIGLSIADLTIIDKKITANAQYKNEAIRIAEAEIEEQFNFVSLNSSVLSSALASTQALTPHRFPGGCTASTDECQQINLEFIRNTLPPNGYSIEQHFGYTGSLFEINSVASFQSTGALSDQTAGITVVY